MLDIANKIKITSTDLLPVIKKSIKITIATSIISSAFATTSKSNSESKYDSRVVMELIKSAQATFDAANESAQLLKETQSILNQNISQPQIVKIHSDNKNKIDFYMTNDFYIANVLDDESSILYNFNMAMSDFNLKASDFFTPAAEVYYSTPLSIIRFPIQGAKNALKNISEFIVGLVSNLFLVGRPNDALTISKRFAINTTLGLGGLYPAADRLAEAKVTDENVVGNYNAFEKLENSIRQNSESLNKPSITNFAEVFREWGFGCGAFVVFPFIGPTSTQNMLGGLIETPLKPDMYVKPLIIVSAVTQIDQAFTDIIKAKDYLSTLDKNTKDGRLEYYKTVRLNFLNGNNCAPQTKINQYLKDHNIEVEYND